MPTLTAGKYTITVDEQDFEQLQGKHLAFHEGSSPSLYDPARRRSVSIARYLLGLKEGDSRAVWMRDGDSTNLTRANIQVVSSDQRQVLLGARSRGRTDPSSSQRMRDPARNPARKGKTGPTGVYRLPNGKYQARFLAPGTRSAKSLGCYDTEEDAARAHDRAREKAGLEPVNFPPEF